MNKKPDESWHQYYTRYKFADDAGKLKRHCTWKDVQPHPVLVTKGAHYRKTGMREAIGNHFSRVNINGEIWWIKNSKLKEIGIV